RSLESSAVDGLLKCLLHPVRLRLNRIQQHAVHRVLVPRQPASLGCVHGPRIRRREDLRSLAASGLEYDSRPDGRATLNGLLKFRQGQLAHDLSPTFWIGLRLLTSTYSSGSIPAMMQPVAMARGGMAA